VSPLKDRDLNVSPLKRMAATKRPGFHLFDEDDMSSRDSGYNSQNLDEPVQAAAAKVDKPCPGSMDDILHNCSPDKEEGIAPLKSSPERLNGDGFDLHSLETIDEDQENQSPSFDLGSLLSKKILVPEPAIVSRERETADSQDEFSLPMKKVSVGPLFGRRAGGGGVGGTGGVVSYLGYVSPLWRVGCRRVQWFPSSHEASLEEGTQPLRTDAAARFQRRDARPFHSS